MTEKNITGLDLLRRPFDKKHIGKLPKPTKKQTEEVKKDFQKGVRCGVCGGWHHPKVVHLDYVGHAALTDRLLDCDINWYWEPLAFNEMGLPSFDNGGGLWIRLHVSGHSRIGYGNAELSQYKEVGSREKEVIGDALRNAAMRFGAALDLWHKGDLHPEDNGDDPKPKPIDKDKIQQGLKDLVMEMGKLTAKDTLGFLDGLIEDNKTILEQAKEVMPKTHKRTMELRDAAAIRIGSFPGDDDPFGLPETDGVGP